MNTQHVFTNPVLRRGLLAGLIALGCSSTAAAQSRFDISFPTASLDDANQSWATDINESGLVVGSYRADDWKRTKGFAWKDGAIVDVILPQPYDPGVEPTTVWNVHRYAQTTCVNDDGLSAGNTYHYNLGFFETGYFTPIPSPTRFPKLHQSTKEKLSSWWTEDLTTTTPTMIVGMGYRIQSPDDYEFRAFVSKISPTEGPLDGGLTLLPSLGESYHQSSAMAVNDSWTVVGWAENLEGYRRAFRWNDGDASVEDLGTLGGPSSIANDINENGVIVGQADLGDGRQHAFIMDGSGMRDLGSLGGLSSEALAVNDKNVAVGSSWTSRDGIHATIWYKDRILDLNSLVDSSDFVLQKAVAINNQGQIAGWGRRIGGGMEAFVLTPQ